MFSVRAAEPELLGDTAVRAADGEHAGCRKYRVLVEISVLSESSREAEVRVTGRGITSRVSIPKETLEFLA